MSTSWFSVSRCPGDRIDRGHLIVHVQRIATVISGADKFRHARLQKSETLFSTHGAVWLVGWLVGWLLGCLVAWLLAWLVGCPKFEEDICLCLCVCVCGGGWVNELKR